MSRKKNHEHVNHERWLVSYADFITLLFAFFVVMFASSQSDKAKMASLAVSMQTAFKDNAIFMAHSDKPPLDDQAPISPPAASQNNIVPSSSEQQLEAQQLKDELQSAVANDILDDSVSIRDTSAGLIISLSEAGFFDSGSAEIRKQALPTLTKLALALVKAPNNIRVEGHTDDRPIHSAQFDSNWELSTMRATRIARFFMNAPLADPARFSAAGYAQFHPVASNDTEEGRAKNRRVDIVLLPLGTSNSASDLNSIPGMNTPAPPVQVTSPSTTPIPTKLVSTSLPAHSR